MAANNPSIGTGTWTEENGPTPGLVIENINSNTTVVSGIVPGSSVTLRWTIDEGGECDPVYDLVVLTNTQIIPTLSQWGLITLLLSLLILGTVASRQTLVTIS